MVVCEDYYGIFHSVGGREDYGDSLPRVVGSIGGVFVIFGVNNAVAVLVELENDKIADMVAAAGAFIDRDIYGTRVAGACFGSCR